MIVIDIGTVLMAIGAAIAGFSILYYWSK